jgi:two-component system chemotaxis response regulator CheB
MTACLSGRLEAFLLPQVIALLEAVQLSGHLETRSEAGDGQLAFRRGRIVGAQLGSLSGELAAYSILSWSKGEFRFLDDGVEPPGDLSRSNQSLCLEAMRLLDECANPTLTFAATGQGPVGALLGPLREVHAALRSGSKTIDEIATECRLPPLQTYHSLECLEQAGLVSRLSGGTPNPISLRGGDAPLRVLVVDDSELMRRTLTRLFESDPTIKVVAAASGGLEALALLPVVKPDVVTLDLHMPEMDGVTTLKRIMLTEPTPTVIMTASSPDALDQTFEMILRFGAIDFITKPSRSRGPMDEQGRYIHSRLRNAARVNLRGVRLFQPRPSPAPRRARSGACRAFVTAVAGTGGCLSFMQLLSDLPADLPFGLLGLLPFPDAFLAAFVAYMNRFSAFEVRLATDGAPLLSGVCYLTSGSEPWRLVSDGGRQVLRTSSTHGPCDANLLLYDSGYAFREKAIGLVLSSERRDLSSGLSAVRAAGGMTMAQLPETCVDSEGPAEALALGLVDKVTVLNRISTDLSQFFMDRLHGARGSDPLKVVARHGQD